MYRIIDSRFWSDPKVKKLSSQEKLIFLYLVTNAHTHVSGIYHLAPHTIAVEIGLPLATVKTALNTLSKHDIIRFISAENLVWVMKMMMYQGRGEKHARSAAYHLVEDLHNCSLTKEFVQVYPDVKPFLDTLLDRVSKIKLHQTTPESNIPDTYIPDSNIPESSDSESISFQRFDEFWKSYPRKENKPNARTAWKKLNPDEALLQTILKAVGDQKQSEGWLKEKGRFIPHPATWLNGRRWEDEPPEPLYDAKRGPQTIEEARAHNEAEKRRIMGV